MKRLRILTFLACLIPFVALVSKVVQNDLGPDPAPRAEGGRVRRPAAGHPGAGTRRRREARQTRSEGERRSTPGGEPPGRVRWRRAACHHNL